MVMRAYREVGCYVDGDPSTDNGTSCLDDLRWFRKAGVLDSYVSVSPRRFDLLEVVIFLLGGLYCGFDLPRSAQSQAIWDVAPVGKRDSSYDANSWGGHAVMIVDYDVTGFWCVTWGRLQRMTRAFFSTYIDECYAPVYKTWCRSRAPSGYLAGQIAAAVASIHKQSTGWPS